MRVAAVLCLVVAVAGCAGAGTGVGGATAGADTTREVGISFDRFPLDVEACDSANIHVYRPLAELEAIVPPPFEVVPYQTDLTGVMVVNVVQCAKGPTGAALSTVEVTVLIVPPVMPAAVVAPDAPHRVPHEDAGLALDQYLVAAFTTDAGLEVAYVAAGVFAGPATADVLVAGPPEATVVVAEVEDAGGAALTYAGAATTNRYGDVTHRFWHLDDAHLAVFEHHLPDPPYAFPGVMACAVRPDSALAALMGRPVCHPVMASAVYGFSWTGNAYVFPATVLESDPDAVTPGT